MKPINVLSLCDGMSTGQLCLEQAGIPVKYYAASETDKYCIKVATHNYPKTFHLGDIRSVQAKRIPFNIDLLLSGSPCQGFSFAGKQLKFDDPRSQLFFQFVRILRETRWYNPKVKFLFENVRMDKKSLKIITTLLGVEPIYIDSALVCAQTRKRYYWTNIEGIELPEDRGIVIADILEDEVDERYNLSDAVLDRINKDEVLKQLQKMQKDRTSTHQVNPAKEFGGQPRNQNRIYDSDYKAPTITESKASFTNVAIRVNKSQDGKVFSVYGKSQCVSAGHSNVPKVAIAGAVRGRYEDDGTITQRVEVNNTSKSIALTSVQKDNVVIGVVNSNNDMRKVVGNKSTCVDANYAKGMDNHAQRTHIASLPVVCNRQGGLKKNQIKASAVTVGGHGSGNHSDMDILVQEVVAVHNMQPRNGKGIGGKGHLSRQYPEKSYCVDTGNGQAIETNLTVRRFTPIEVERLQGLPDNFTSVDGIISDSQRYKMCGNGWQADTVTHILSHYRK